VIISRLVAVVLLSLVPLAAANDDFVPNDVARAVALGCEVSGNAGPPAYAEAQVFVKFSKSKPGWDYRPIIARRDLAAGGAPAALGDCIEWLKQVKRKLEEASRGQ